MAEAAYILVDSPWYPRETSSSSTWSESFLAYTIEESGSVFLAVRPRLTSGFHHAFLGSARNAPVEMPPSTRRIWPVT
jgi:hypothetical protein